MKENLIANMLKNHTVIEAKLELKQHELNTIEKQKTKFENDLNENFENLYNKLFSGEYANLEFKLEDIIKKVAEITSISANKLDVIVSVNESCSDSDYNQYHEADKSDELAIARAYQLIKNGLNYSYEIYLVATIGGFKFDLKLDQNILPIISRYFNDCKFDKEWYAGSEYVSLYVAHAKDVRDEKMYVSKNYKEFIKNFSVKLDEIDCEKDDSKEVMLLASLVSDKLYELSLKKD